MRAINKEYSEITEKRNDICAEHNPRKMML